MKIFTHFFVLTKKFNLILFFLCFVFFLQDVEAQNFEPIVVSSVVSGDNTDNALFAASSPSIPTLAFIRAERTSGLQLGTFTINGDNIRYLHGTGGTGIPNNSSEIQFTFLEADQVTPIQPSDIRFIINDIDGPSNEALATDCDSGVRFVSVYLDPIDPLLDSNLTLDNTPPDLSATGTQNESAGIQSRVMYEYNDVNVVRYTNFANNGFLKDFDMDNELSLGTPQFSVCSKDSDNDGVDDVTDQDDDNDGILDVVESNGNDPNGDADGDGLPNFLDTDDNLGDNPRYTPDGSVTDYTDLDSDGQPDVYEASQDADELPNHLDLDSDGDGIPDNIEAQGTGSYVTPSLTSDGVTGIPDNYNQTTGLDPIPDTDVDGIPDYLDLDSDGDNFSDSSESGLTLTGLDEDNDGLDDGVDTTGGVAGDYSDPNGSVNDPATDLPDNDNPGGEVDYRDPRNSDNDNRPDNLDLDDDNDGILDSVELAGVNDPFGDEDGDGLLNVNDVFDNNGPGGDGSTADYTDVNNDGVPDVYDFDLDGLPNHLDLDSDNDGITDNVEAQPTIGYIAPSGIGSGITDGNNNGVDDNYETVQGGTDIGSGENSDTDPAPDFLDLNSDNEGDNDTLEAGFTLATNTNDTDGDGLLDDYDDINGPVVQDDQTFGAVGLPNNQNPPTVEVDFRDSVIGINSDDDSVFDSVDFDDDNDGILDTAENSLNVDPSADADLDGILNYEDFDDNGSVTAPVCLDADLNGICDSLDPVFDFDGDGVPNHFDLDSDNDGIYDVIETGGTDGNNDGRADDFDGDTTNNNGIPSSAGTGISMPTNTDGGADPDYLSLDSDGDGCSDANEAYGDPNADGGDTGVYGPDPATVDPITGIVTSGIPAPTYTDPVDVDSDLTDDYQQVGGPDGDGDGISDACDLIFNDVDNDGVGDAVDLDDDNDGIQDVTECFGEYVDFASAAVSGTAGPVETVTGIDFVSLNATADLTITESGGDLNALSLGGPSGVFNNPEHTPAPGVAIQFISSGINNNNTIGNDVDFVLVFNKPVYEIIVHFRNLARSNYQFTGAQHTEELVSSNAAMTYIGGTRLLENITVVPPEVGGSGSVRITATSPAGMTQIEWSLIENASNPNASGLSLFTFSADCDLDGDGVPNRFDLDADNDGIYDVVEAGGVDSDNDGRHDDDDNNVDNTATNGIPSDTPLSNGIPNPTDTGSDGSRDYLNLDSDTDGCSDANEAYNNSNADGGDTGVFGVDPAGGFGTIVDANGVVTAALPYATPADTNTNTTADYQEAGPDDDGDGIANACDLVFNDGDDDNVGDVLDIDDDGDGILDVTENSLGVDPSADADSDGIPNYQDFDDNGSVTAPVCIDADLNGICDTLDPVFDTDADGVANHFDLDADNDGIPDNVEAQTTGAYIAPIATTPAEYIANNGVNNAYLTTNGGGPGLPLVNTDGPADIIPDYLDTDSDEDSILDIVENGDTDNAIVVFADADGDGIDDLFDTIDNTVTWDINDAVTTGNIADLQTVYGDFDNDAAPVPVPLASDLSFRDNCQIIAGVIAADETICEGGDPVAFTETTATSIDAGAITYQWQSSTTSAIAGFANIVGATTATFDSPAITQDTWFKRIDTNTLNGNSCVVETNVVAITVNNITAGVIAADQTICEGDTAATLTEVTPTSGDPATFTYQWQFSTTSATATDFVDVAGVGTGVTYDPGVLTADTWFKRIDTGVVNGQSCSVETNVVAITVNNITAGVIAADQTICEGDTAATLTEVTPTSGDPATFTYQWQFSTTSATATDFVNVAGVGTGVTYDPGVLTADTWFKRIDTGVVNGQSCSVETNVIEVTVNNITAGVIAADQTICEGDTAATLTEVTPTSGDPATFTYQWQFSTTSATATDFVNVAGVGTGVTYDPGVLTADTWFKRIDTGVVNGQSCSVETNVIEVTVNNITAGVIAADQTICEGDTAATLTEVTPTSGDPATFTYQWQFSTTSATATDFV
ncbi:hypothetical protein ABW637_09290, partial [Aquimarina sp. 2304DJ70-9]